MTGGMLTKLQNKLLNRNTGTVQTNCLNMFCCLKLVVGGKTQCILKPMWKTTGYSQGRQHIPLAIDANRECHHLHL